MRCEAGQPRRQWPRDSPLAVGFFDAVIACASMRACHLTQLVGGSLVVLGIGFACSTTQRAAVETAAANALISDEDEKKIGLAVKGELEQKQHVHYLDDVQVVGYVRDVAGRVIAYAKKDRPQVTWTVQVIDDPKTVNAFATPGGFLYVYSGLGGAAADEAELAGVSAH